MKTEILQHKDGVRTERVWTESGSFIRKTFEASENAREIENYRILNRINVPTLQVIHYSDRSIDLEDISCSAVWRLGRGGDLSDPAVARAVARWYRQLHDRGKATVRADMYDESDLFTLENIRGLPLKTDTVGCAAWELLERNFVEIRAKLDQLPRTLTYNDFYWTNLAVFRDGAEALMFDYNLMGRGYAYSDVRNVTVSLSPEAADVFVKEYGEVNPMEKLVDDVVSVVVTLILASHRETFPAWAKESCRLLRTELPDRIEKLLRK